LNVSTIDALIRQCEKKTTSRRSACCLFWTLGGNQVGKAAISGWREVVRPAQSNGAKLWPFDGTLSALAASSKLVVCKTYPAEAYGHVGVRFRPGGSKRRQNDRREAVAGLASWCEERSIHLTSAASCLVTEGFGSRKEGVDVFDAAIGLLGMIEVVEGRRPECPIASDASRWEGWILGQGI
jgi:hypothetical protein